MFLNNPGLVITSIREALKSLKKLMESFFPENALCNARSPISRVRKSEYHAAQASTRCVLHFTEKDCNTLLLKTPSHKDPVHPSKI
jgi:hypothetical protein